ncbi:MAG: thioredoxin domain-containing protein [Betaproteobacteria bacterium]|nr:thioredoxin domain-containing protein [Betaproteobacteria bacterium]
MPNRLARETSPYLQQHADNPVDWHPWGEEALELARDHDKPILLSVGYSACHWCHVMAHESFEDPGTAAIMNALFVNIKVDREERPDLDQIYQTAHHLLTRRSGGWPLTMFLTPAQKPFFGGTYFPKTSRYGLPGFGELLEKIAAVYREKRSEIDRQNESLLEFLAGTLPAAADAVEMSRRPITMAAAELQSGFDEIHGGIGAAPKFPHPFELAFCLRVSRSTGDTRLRDLVILTLRKMAQGGIYDQLGGGFCRYSTDACWLIPHFEKMLYDNGPLLRLYADAWLVTGEPLFKRICEETAGWVMREMQSPEGGYYSSLDADSEHEEGKFYVWSREEFAAPLTEDEYEIAAAYFGLDRAPNFEDHAWNPYMAQPMESVAAKAGRNLQECESLLQSARAKLFVARDKRVRPGRDEKILTSWNALMIEGMAHAARVFGRDDWHVSARGAMNFVTATMWKQGRLLATYKNGRAHLNGYLDDYAFLLAASLEMLQAEFAAGDLQLATALADTLFERFEDRAAGGFFFTSDDHEALILRPKPGADNATPSGNGVAALVLTRLGHLLGESRYLQAADKAVRLFYPVMLRQPGGFSTLCTGLEEVLEPTRVIVLRGPRDALRPWQQTLSSRYLPDAMTLAVDSASSDLPGVLNKPVGATVNAYLCRGVICLAPVGDVQALLANLETG